MKLSLCGVYTLRNDNPNNLIFKRGGEKYFTYSMELLQRGNSFVSKRSYDCAIKCLRPAYDMIQLHQEPKLEV